jgi:pyruvate formate lyase activating enzyme
MKYIASGKQVIYPDDYDTKVKFLHDSKKWVETKLAKGILEAAYSYPSGKGFLIFNVGSHKELTKELIAFPLFCLSEFEIHPLCEFGEYADTVVDEFIRLGVYQPNKKNETNGDNEPVSEKR